MSRYDEASRILLDAIELPADQRSAYIVQRANGDEALAREVMSLLAAHERAEGFLETPIDTSTLDADTLDVGRTIGPYTIEGRLGSGGMGVVYRAEDTRLGRTVAVKAIAPRFTHDDEWRERLRREARAAAALNHPGIATVYALEEIEHRLYLIVEHIPGRTLRDAIAGGPLPLGDVLAIGRRVADALAYAHDHGVVHRDLKPENVMLGADGGAKILDFGLARMFAPGSANDALPAGGALTAAGAVFGTPAYMSPEQLRGETAGPASDIFALGILLAELASGRHPFGAERGPALMAKILSAEPDVSTVPVPLRPVIAGCLARTADDRFRSAHEVRAALDTVLRGGQLRQPDRSGAFGWWQFHQAGACIFSAVLIVWVWIVLVPLPIDRVAAIVTGAVVSGTMAVTLRLYVWFAARTRPSDPPPRSAPVIARLADVALAAAAFTAGTYLTATRPIAAGLLMAAAVVMTIVGLVIEPATARAAHR